MKDTKFCAERLFALADPCRLQIVQFLRSGPHNVTQISEGISNTITTTSHHLKIMEHAGIVEGIKRGRFVVYRIHPDVFSTSDCLDLGCCKFWMKGD